MAITRKCTLRNIHANLCLGVFTGGAERGESGQSLTEFAVVGALVLVPLFLFTGYIGKWGFTQLRAIEAVRYVAWERTVWRTAPPSGRAWAAIKSDDQLREEVAQRFFSGRGEAITASTASTAIGTSHEPLLTRHDGQPLLADRAQVAVETHEEAAPALLKGAWGIGQKLLGLGGGFPLEMSGPTVATVSVPITGIPQFQELARPLTFTAQAAVLTDAWTANGPGEEKRLVQGMLPSNWLNNPAVKSVAAVGIWLFPELGRFEPATVDPEVQYGDRLQPMPRQP